MSVLSKRTVDMRGGDSIVLRSAEQRDGAAILELSRAILAEEIFMITSADEFRQTVEAQEGIIVTTRTKTGAILLVALEADAIVGILDFQVGAKTRTAHAGGFAVSVAKSHRGKGIGAALVAALIDWAKQTGTVEKIGLGVHHTNVVAQALYRKFGFVVEGIKVREIKYENGDYVDLISMALFIR